MFRQTLQMGSALYVVASAVLLASCTTTPSSMGGGPPPKPTVEVKVAGTPAQLAAFDKAFRPSVGSEPLACLVMVNAAPSPCDDLQTASVPPSATDLTYQFLSAHTFVYEKLGSALNQVQPTFAPGLPALTIRPILPPDPDCGLLPQPCVAAPYCIQYGRCSQQQIPCTKCQ